jgi:hypothetical protein
LCDRHYNYIYRDIQKIPPIHPSFPIESIFLIRVVLLIRRIHGFLPDSPLYLSSSSSLVHFPVSNCLRSTQLSFSDPIHYDFRASRFDQKRSSKQGFSIQLINYDNTKFMPCLICAPNISSVLMALSQLVSLVRQRSAVYYDMMLTNWRERDRRAEVER